jgi:hypothetical protein
MTDKGNEITNLTGLVREGRWTHEPVTTVLEQGTLRVAAAEGSDAWRHTSYGFVHDSEHGLLAPMRAESAAEVSFVLDYTQQFDQAGLFLRESPTEWIKAGVEVSDGAPQVGAVVTHGTSDWSVAPVPEWAGRLVTIRASRSGDAVVIRARVDEDGWRLVRVAHVKPDSPVAVGLYCAAPTRAGLTVTFTAYRTTDTDSSLH